MAELGTVTYFLLFRISLQDDRIAPLGTENNTKEGKRQGKKGKKNIEYRI